MLASDMLHNHITYLAVPTATLRATYSSESTTDSGSEHVVDDPDLSMGHGAQFRKGFHALGANSSSILPLHRVEPTLTLWAAI